MAIISGIKIFGSGAKPPVLEELQITENGTYTPSDGVDGFNPVNVNVQPPLQAKAVEITANGQSTIEADSGYYGLESVGLNVNVQPSLQAKSTSTTITENGTSTITLQPDSNYDGLSSASVDVNVNVPIPEFTTEELVATANGTYTPSTDGYSKVRVNVSEPVSKYVVPNGMKFGKSKVFNAGDFDVSQVTDMSEMFSQCSSLTSLDLSNWNVSQVTDMRQMFYWCMDLTSLNLSSWDVSQVTDMSHMFYNCGDYSGLRLLGISAWNVSSVTKMRQMFASCEIKDSLDLSNWNVSQVTDMSGVFESCSSISLGISNWEVSQVTNMGSMLYNCRYLTSIDLSTWNVSQVTDMQAMFGNCVELTNLNINGWDMRSITNINSMFDYSEKLTDLNMTNAILPKINLTNWGLNTCKALTVDSLVSVLNALPQLDEGTSYTCTIGSDNLAKLTDEQKAIATNKGWTLN